QGGIPAQQDAASVAGFAKHGVEHGGAVTLREGFGPREHHTCNGVDLERGALKERGQVFGRPGEHVDGALLQDPARAAEAGDGVDGAVVRRRGDPLRAARIVRTHHEHAWTDPGAMPRAQRTKQLPQIPRLLHRRRARRRKAAGGDGIDLAAGEPDFPTPSLPSGAGVRAIREGKSHYPANEGILELRAAAAKHLSLLSGGRPVNADNVVVSNGSKQSLFNVCFTLFGPGDVVAIPAPAWVSYPQIVHLARARPVLVSGEPEWSLKVSVRDLDRVVPGARGLILCSPCNPTGAVYTQAEIKAIAHWARDRKVWI